MNYAFTLPPSGIDPDEPEGVNCRDIDAPAFWAKYDSGEVFDGWDLLERWIRV